MTKFDGIAKSSRVKTGGSLTTTDLKKNMQVCWEQRWHCRIVSIYMPILESGGCFKVFFRRNLHKIPPPPPIYMMTLWSHSHRSIKRPAGIPFSRRSVQRKRTRSWRCPPTRSTGPISIWNCESTLRMYHFRRTYSIFPFFFLYYIAFIVWRF